MIFNSIPFLVFFPVVLALYGGLGRRGQNAVLLAASYFFYGWWDWRFLSLLAGSTLLDYVAALGIEAARTRRRRRAWLLASLAGNLGILGVFKYFGFFSRSAQAMLEAAGLHASLPVLDFVLPVGISFYTFQTMSYTIDVYRGAMRPTRDFGDFALYVAYFPQLVAGPIERAGRLLPQLARERRVTGEQVRTGLLLILIGYFRKVGIADAVAPLVDDAFAAPERCSGGQLLCGLLLFSVQIYCDFAGYSDIARGCSRLFGIELMENFNQPYLSASITEFWRRWHVSLSTWLRDYLYVPLGGNRRGRARTYANLMLTMLLGGLWHGANGTFVAWGGLHGAYLAVHKALGGKGEGGPRGARSPAAYPFKVAGVFGLVALGWIFFRSPGFGAAWEYLSGIVSWREGMGPASSDGWRVAVYGGAMLWVDAVQRRGGDHAAMLRWNWGALGLAAGAMAVWMFVLGGADGAVPFIYFQF